MPAERLVKIPDGIDDVTAATLMLKGLTVQYLFRQTYPLKGGETILFHAAAGGVGLIACQWARALGVTMIGTVGSDDKAELAKANGCAHTIVYTREDFVARTKEITGGKGVPVVYDSIGKDTFPQSLDCLSPRGLFVSYGSCVGSDRRVQHRAARAEGLAVRDAADALHLRGDTRETLDAMADDVFDAGARRQDQVGGAAAVSAEGRGGRASRARVARDDRRDGALLSASCILELRARARVQQRARASGNSDAVTPSGPQPRATSASAAAPCRHTAKRNAVARRSAARAARREVRDSTSPLPAVASAGPPLALMSHVPSGCASTLPAPFSTTLAASRCASSRAALMRSFCTLVDVDAEHARRFAGMRRRERRRAARLRRREQRRDRARSG